MRDGAEAAGWSPRQALLLRAADELHAERRIGDELWARSRASYDERELIELCLLVGHYEMLAMTLRSLEVQPDRCRAAGAALAARAARAAPRGAAHEARRRGRSRLRGKRCLITGAASGIGRATALAAAARGAELCLTDLHAEGARARRRGDRAAGGTVAARRARRRRRPRRGRRARRRRSTPRTAAWTS